MTVIFRHRKWAWVGLPGPWALLWRFKIVTDYTNLWWFSENRHGGQSMTISKTITDAAYWRFLVIRDRNFSSWITRILVVIGRASRASPARKIARQAMPGPLVRHEAQFGTAHEAQRAVLAQPPSGHAWRAMDIYNSIYLTTAFSQLIIAFSHLTVKPNRP
jgi:hypothetical protein